MAVAKDCLFLTVGPRFLVYDAATGRRRGEFRNPSLEALSPPTAVGDVALASDSRGVFAIDDNGREVWQYEFGPSTIGWENIASQPPVATREGTILAPGPDGYVHALDRRGVRLWQTRVGVYGQGRPALAIAATADLLLLDTRMTPHDRPNLVGVDLQDAGKRIRFVINLGIDVSGLVADGRAGIVATSYVETKSRRGASTIASFDERGIRRWTIDRGRHEAVHGISSTGDVVVVSQDAATASPDTVLEKWSSEGQLKSRHPLDMVVLSVLVGSDDVLYVVGCRDQAAVFQAFHGNLSRVRPIEIQSDCPRSVTLDDRGRLFLIGTQPRTAADEPSVDLTVVQTSSPAAARSWAGPRAHADGAGSFSFAER
ncbi:MAG: hypothetical protein ABJA82_01765 [Myxococcales bacterium]